MSHVEDRIPSLGEKLLTHKGGTKLSMHGWTQSLLNRMMDNETFRVASLRFTDVAPTLRNDQEFMDHLTAYFGEGGGALSGFIGNKVPGSGFLAKVVSPLVRRNIKSMAHSFIAGETIDDGINTFKELHDQNIACSIDLLGEAVLSEAEAEIYMNAYKEALNRISQESMTWNTPQYPEADRFGPIARTNVSIKLSALYEHIKPTAHDHTVEKLTERMAELMDIAVRQKAYIHIDVEQFELLPMTLDVFENILMDERYKDYPHIGIVCQAYLVNSDALLDHLIHLGKKRGTPFSIRLVKGAYWDYEHAFAEQMDWPCPVFSNKEATDARFEELTSKLLKAFPTVRPCIGSHNARSISHAIAVAENLGLEKGDVEFQVLYGMAENFRDWLVEQGFRVRQYCPVGEFIPGMSYLVRRLLENTANQSFLRKHGRSEVNMDELLKQPNMPQKEKDKELGRFANHPLVDFSLEAHRKKAEKALEYFKKQMPVNVHAIVNGKKVENRSHFTQKCPWNTNIVVSRTTMAKKQDADNAIKLAKDAFADWRDQGAKKRADILEKAADLFVKNWDELFALQVFEAGKDWRHADADIAEGIDFTRASNSFDLISVCN